MPIHQFRGLITFVNFTATFLHSVALGLHGLYLWMAPYKTGAWRKSRSVKSLIVDEYHSRRGYAGTHEIRATRRLKNKVCHAAVSLGVSGTA
jgi:hypothetical protein